jgi:hypothetical protein
VKIPQKPRDGCTGSRRRPALLLAGLLAALGVSRQDTEPHRSALRGAKGEPNDAVLGELVVFVGLAVIVLVRLVVGLSLHSQMSIRHSHGRRLLHSSTGPETEVLYHNPTLRRRIALNGPVTSTNGRIWGREVSAYTTRM